MRRQRPEHLGLIPVRAASVHEGPVRAERDPRGLIIARSGRQADEALDRIGDVDLDEILQAFEDGEATDVTMRVSGLDAIITIDPES